MVVNVMFSLLERAVLPPTCVLCGAEGAAAGQRIDLCIHCMNDLPRSSRACVYCAIPLIDESHGALLCGQCLRKRPRFDSASCAFHYGYPIDHLVRALKFHGRLAYGRVLGELLARHLLQTHADRWPQLLIPVPLSELRFRERGFNQAIELGQRLERRLKIPLDTGCAVRTRHTREQTGLDNKARRKNLRRAFEVTRKLSVEHVAIVDDVITTGSTMNELARTLKRAGVKRIEAWAVARTGNG